MAIIETKADELMDVIYKRKSITTKAAAKLMNVDETYVRRLAYVMQKHELINLSATSLSLTMISIEK